MGYYYSTKGIEAGECRLTPLESVENTYSPKQNIRTATTDTNRLTMSRVNEIPNESKVVANIKSLSLTMIYPTVLSAIGNEMETI